MTNHISSSAGVEIARGFITKNLNFNNLTQTKTLFKIINPAGLITLVDVSWLSPFPGEQELIVGGRPGRAIVDPDQFLRDMTIFDDQTFVKTIIIDMSFHAAAYEKLPCQKHYVSKLPELLKRLRQMEPCGL